MTDKSGESVAEIPVVPADIMKHDPIAGFLLSRRFDVTADNDLERRGGLILKEGLNFLLRSHLDDKHPDFVTTQGAKEIRVLNGGALKYQSSAGDAFTWLSGIIPIKHGEDITQFVLTEEALLTSSLYLLVSSNTAYDNSSRRETLLFVTGESGLGRGRGYRRPGPAVLTDYNFFDAVIRKARQGYPASTVDIEEK